MALKILIVKIGGVADVIQSMPMLGAIYEAEPRSHVSWLVGKSSADVLRGHPRINKLFVLDDQQLFKGGIMSRLGVIREVFGQLDRGYDLVLIGHRDPGYSFALRPVVWGPIFQIANEDAPSQFRNTVHIPPGTMHESMAMRKLLGAGLKKVKRTLKYNWTEPFLHIGKSPARTPEKYAVMHYLSQKRRPEVSLKQWPGILELVKYIQNETVMSTVVLGTRDDRPEFEKWMDSDVDIDPSRVVNLMGEISIREMVSIIRGGEIFVGGDSDPLAIADALGMRTIGLFGPTSPIARGLQGGLSRSLIHNVPCSPCFKGDGVFPACPFEHRCMRGLGIEEVCKTVDELLDFEAAADSFDDLLRGDS